MKCEYCGSNDNVVAVIATHYTDEITEPMCIYCRSAGVAHATMDHAHEKLEENKNVEL